MSSYLKICGIVLLIVISHKVWAEIPGIKVPSGFDISVYAEPVPDARFMTLGDQNIVYVGTTENKVYALVPGPNGGQAKATLIADHLDSPNGVAYYHGDLYVAETGRILRFPNITSQLNKPPKPIVVYDQLPNKKWHGYRVIRFSADGWLYVSIGMPCNICNYRSSNPLFGTIIRMRPDGSQMAIYAKGIRNSMGFDWQPGTHALWFTDNGQDYMGDELPPDEINYAPKAGMDFGFPYVYGNNIPIPGQEQADINRSNFTEPVFNLPAHVAPLGLEFYTGSSFPPEYRQQMFIAEHGSWNRSKKIGYQVVFAKMQDNKIIEVIPFASGWLQGQTPTGRPVDLLTMPDGSLLVSDDFGGKVYRIKFNSKE